MSVNQIDVILTALLTLTKKLDIVVLSVHKEMEGNGLKCFGIEFNTVIIPNIINLPLIKFIKLDSLLV